MHRPLESLDSHTTRNRSPWRCLAVKTRARLPTGHPYPRRIRLTQCRSRPNGHKSSRSPAIVSCEHPRSLGTRHSLLTQAHLRNSPHIQPDPSNPMDNRPSFTRCLAGAARTPPRPLSTPQSRSSPLVGSNGNPTSHAELDPHGLWVLNWQKLPTCGVSIGRNPGPAGFESAENF